MNDSIRIKSRGTRGNPVNRFAKRHSVLDVDPFLFQKPQLQAIEKGEESPVVTPLEDPEQSPPATLGTEYIDRPCQSIVSSNDSPDLPFQLSINPYQGCEHGCVYCYARPTHEYLDLSLGLDFETKIHFKSNAVEKLRAYLSRPSYRCQPINIGANTDPYQQIERQLGITRSLLQLMLECRQPVTIITKGSAVLRDIDILKALAKQHLVKVMISVTSLNNELKANLEPRAAAPVTRLKIVETLAQTGVPVGVLMAPIIPAINDMEIESIVQACAKAGASSMHYVLLRLPHQLKDLFDDWLTRYYPQRKNKVLHLLEECHGGRIYQSEFGVRQTGSGIYAKMIGQRFDLACQRYGISHLRETGLRTDLFQRPQHSRQIDLFQLS